MIRCLLAVLLAMASVSGCHLLGPDPEAASLPPVFGARVTDGQLRLWTGAPCSRVSRVVVNFSPGSARLILEPPEGQRPGVEFLTIGGPYPGLDVIEELPAGFDWGAEQEVALSVESVPAGAGSTPVDITEVVEHSAEHSADTYYFGGIGWRDTAQIAEENRASLLTLCTPDPATEPSLPPAFGARITGGMLRISTGTPCTGTNGVTLAFESGGATPHEVTTSWFAPAGSPVDVNRFTVGEPLTGMQVKTALPDGFDWRTMQSLTLRMHRPELNREATTPLREVIDGSPGHPEDTYYFQGVGWLNPDQVAEQAGTTFLGPCTPDPAK